MKSPDPGTSRAVLTIAVGPKIYFEMAIALARSIRLWHDALDLPIAIATDSSDLLPADLFGVRVLHLQRGELGVGFEPKLHLDRIAPAERTLFIDADCLVYSRLDGAFEAFAGQAVSVVRERLSGDGERFGDVASYCQHLSVEEIPIFTGGIYYLEGPEAQSVYAQARHLLLSYDRLGLVRLRGLPNEEVLVSGAMACHNLWGVPDGGSIVGDFQTSPGRASLDIIRGESRMTNPPPPSPDHCPWAPVRSIAPAIVHFLGSHNRLPDYRAEAATLRWIARGVPAEVARLTSRLAILWPRRSLLLLKSWLRPLYRRIFGTRPIPPTERTSA